MATISSHVLDSVIGTHAAGIRVECYRYTEPASKTLVFDKTADRQGRVSETIYMEHDDATIQYELTFHSNAYYAAYSLPNDDYQIIKSIVLRLDLPDAQGNYHLPIMLSPHSYSVWWSGAPN